MLHLIFAKYIFFIIFKSLRSSVSEGILAVDERMSKQEDIRKKKVRHGVYPKPWLSALPALWGLWCPSLGTLLRRMLTSVLVQTGLLIPSLPPGCPCSSVRTH